MTIEKKFEEQVKEGTRFNFGKNWNAFLSNLDGERIRVAEDSLTEMLECENLNNKTFLDIGCGSGLFSLAAQNLSADVYSLDFDPDSVACAKFLKEKFHPQSKWTIEEGSVLDKDYIASLGEFDVVYSWGVLHHTGNMELALSNATLPVKSGGKLFIGIYNESKQSKFWLKVKEMYNKNIFGKALIVSIFVTYFFIRGFFSDILRLKNPFKRYEEYKQRRGMSIVHDWYDWLGGLPYEVATPEFIIDFHKKRGFRVEKIRTVNTKGINEFVFSKV